ncbi:hypothetical protein JYT15_00070 [Acidimicrobium ferrooxidans]|nr:hypothetical protein [Acidimicrobium ferrooxidans]
MVVDNADMSTESSRVVLFVSRLQCDVHLPLDVGAFRMRRFEELELASWQRLRSMVVSKTVHYRDAPASTESYGGPIWDVREQASNPATLSDLCALDFGETEVEKSLLRAGQVIARDPRSDLGLLLLKLTDRGLIRPVREFIFYPEQPESASGGTTWSYHHITPKNWEVMDIGEAQVSTLRALTDVLWSPMLSSYFDWPDDCLVAATHFAKADSGNRLDRVLDLWISLEAMFGPTDMMELSHRISQRGAMFCADSQDRLEIYKLLKKDYGTRSKFVHGTDKPSKRDPNEPFSEQFRRYWEVEDVVRRCLRRYLRCRLVDGISRKDLHQRLELQALDAEVAPLPTDPGARFQSEENC